MDKSTLKHADELRKCARTGGSVELPLETDDRVLARVTDGIYRQPASAIRELIVNAYDADATEVAVVTDAPRYSTILVRDNGNGMSAEALISMIRHIGGSAKRTHDGQELGITDPTNPTLSPNGRRLIGKMGIGLFSVSQLTRQFTITTKPKDENYRYTAVVTLHRYTDESLPDTALAGKFQTGRTTLTSTSVPQDEGHGTTIVLGNLIPRARHVLQSTDMWQGIHVSAGHSMRPSRVIPIVHSGEMSSDNTTYNVLPDVPWDSKAGALERMAAISDKLIEAAKDRDIHGQVDTAFDYYFQMIWSLGLALPLPYIDMHPFDLPGGTKTRCFLLSNQKGSESQAVELETSPHTSVMEKADFVGVSVDRDKGFSVEIDGIRLAHPIRFDVVPGTSRALQTPLLFVGSYSPDLSKYDKTQSGGQELRFTGYLYWTPRVIPKEHNGLLIRINGASGTLFDPTFLMYQVAERQRMKQVVAEVLVTNGLEEALNIDRESFNTAHPHYQIVLNWVHNALRQVFNKQKELESDVRKQRRSRSAARSLSTINSIREAELKIALDEDDDTVPSVAFTDDEQEAKVAQRCGGRAYPLNETVLATLPRNSGRPPSASDPQVQIVIERAEALVQVLDAYGLLDGLDFEQQKHLVKGILRIFNSGD